MSLPPGWGTAAEADELRRLAAGRAVLELGAWKGRSTTILAEAARYVVSVDRHQGIPPAHEGDSLPDYLDAVRGLTNVAVVVARFEDIVPFLHGFDLVYVDGDHDMDAVERDVTLALLVDPAVVALHDWDFDDVRCAASTFFGDPDAVVGSVASFRRRP